MNNLYPKGHEKVTRKRGISTVITTLILVLLVLVAIGILWVVIKGMVIKEAAEVESLASLIGDEVKITRVSIDPLNDLILDMYVLKETGEISVSTTIITGSPLEVDIITVNDFSGSMRCSNFIDSNCALSEVNCINICGGVWEAPATALKEANIILVNKIFDESSLSKVGLVAFSNLIVQAYTVGLLNNLTDLSNKINSWDILGIPSQSTNMSGGIIYATNVFHTESSPDKTKVMIVLSDGVANSIDRSKQAAFDANSTLENLTIHSVGLGGNVNEDLLKNISARGGGNYYLADISNLVSVYSSISDQIINTYNDVNALNGLKFVFYDNNSNIITIKKETPNVLVKTKYSFDLTGTGLSGYIEKIEIYPYTTSSGNEVTGGLIESIKL